MYKAQGEEGHKVNVRANAKQMKYFGAKSYAA